VTVDFSPETRAILNDGLGTEATLNTLGSIISLTNNLGATIVDEWRDEVNNDDIPPEEFTIELVKGDGISYGDQYYITFNTTDKQTGLSHYEVIEETTEDVRLFRFGAATAPWVRTENNVYVLKDQSLRSTVRVRAIDKAGNEYIATLAPTNIYRYFYEDTRIIIGLTVVFIGGLLTLVLWYIWRRRKQKRSVETILPADLSSNI